MNWLRVLTMLLCVGPLLTCCKVRQDQSEVSAERLSTPVTEDFSMLMDFPAARGTASMNAGSKGTLTVSMSLSSESDQVVVKDARGNVVSIASYTSRGYLTDNLNVRNGQGTQVATIEEGTSVGITGRYSSFELNLPSRKNGMASFTDSLLGYSISFSIGQNCGVEINRDSFQDGWTGKITHDDDTCFQAFSGFLAFRLATSSERRRIY